MRGKVAKCALVAKRARITPAHAGKSTNNARLIFANEDHPRPCGEKLEDDLERFQTAGSPPPMRGKDDVLWLWRWALRITPAHAGKSKLGDNCTLDRWDHPRPCGEKTGTISP